MLYVRTHSQVDNEVVAMESGIIIELTLNMENVKTTRKKKRRVEFLSTSQRLVRHDVAEARRWAFQKQWYTLGSVAWDSEKRGRHERR